MSRGPFRILSSELSRGWDVRAGCWMIYLPGVQRGRFRILSSEMSRGWDVRAASWMIYLPGFSRGRFRMLSAAMTRCRDVRAVSPRDDFCFEVEPCRLATTERNSIREDKRTTEEY